MQKFLSKYLRGGLVAGVTALVLSAGELASFGAASPPKLTGERLASVKGTGGTSARCKGATGSFTFKVKGTAKGPYPGAFTATGKVTVRSKRPTSLSATVVISSRKGNVRITEKLAKSSANNAFCLPGYGLAGVVASYQASVRRAGHTTRQAGTITGAIAGGAAKTSALREFVS
jgi:hypothetical protein